MSEFVEETKMDGRPKVPERPLTRRECWEHIKHFYGDVKTPAELESFAKRWWVESYVLRVSLRGWNNPPDWKEGDAIAEKARPIPGKTFTTENRGRWEVLMYELLQIQRDQAPARPRKATA